MITFNIFKKKKGIYWTRTLIFYTILVPSLAIFLVRKEMDFDTNIIDDILICLIVGSLIYAFIVGSVGLVRYETIKGRLEGFMVLNLNTIHIDYKVYHLNDIKKIEIFNGDYKGSLNVRSSGSIEPVISQGVENEIIITMNSGEVEKHFFQLLNENDLSKAEKELINYHLKGKIHFLHLIDILNITDYNKIQQFKKEISYMSE